MKLAAIQMRSGVNPEANLRDAADLITQAAEAGADIIVTPEMTHLLQRRPKLFWATVCAPKDDPAIAAFSELAKSLKITLVIGSLALTGTDNRAVNRSLVFGPDGAQLAHYDKIHLFDVDLGRGQSWKESAIYAPGDAAVLVDMPAAKLGLTICYDVRFPHLYRDLAKAGAQIITVPAAFTVPTGQAHWEVLLRARAIETGSFIIAPAQGGEHEDGRTTWGRSLIISPWGEVLAHLDHDAPGIALAEIDLSNVAAARQKIPALTHDRAYRAP